MAKGRRGRPRRIESEAATERIWAFLTPSERAALEAMAAHDGIAVAVVVREAINVFVADSSDEKIFSSTGNSRHPAP